MKELKIYELTTQYDKAQSFGYKAMVHITGESKVLYSYNTRVAEVKNGKAVIHGTYSQTTLRHIKEFLKQEGFRVENKKQIESDYMKG